MLSKSEIQRMLDDAMKLTGEEFEIARGDTRLAAKAIKNTEKGTQRKYVQFYPGTDVKVGDLLIRKASGDEWVVVEVDPRVLQGHVFSVNAYYETKLEREKRQPQAVNYTFHNSSNIIAGSQSSATININIGKIEAEIEEKGGSDKEQLLAMITEIKQAFEKQEVLSKGSLTKFSEMLEKHSWITASLVQLIGSAAIQFLFGG
jgi:hypothetical protein